MSDCCDVVLNEVSTYQYVTWGSLSMIILMICLNVHAKRLLVLKRYSALKSLAPFFVFYGVLRLVLGALLATVFMPDLARPCCDYAQNLTFRLWFYPVFLLFLGFLWIARGLSYRRQAINLQNLADVAAATQVQQPQVPYQPPVAIVAGPYVPVVPSVVGAPQQYQPVPTGQPQPQFPNQQQPPLQFQQYQAPVPTAAPAYTAVPAYTAAPHPQGPAPAYAGINSHDATKPGQ